MRSINIALLSVALLMAAAAPASAEDRTYTIARYDVWTFVLSGKSSTYIRAYDSGSVVRAYIQFSPDFSTASGTFNRGSSYFVVGVPERYYDLYIGIFRQEGVATVSGSFGAGTNPPLTIFHVNSPTAGTATFNTPGNLDALIKELDEALQMPEKD